MSYFFGIEILHFSRHVLGQAIETHFSRYRCLHHFLERIGGMMTELARVRVVGEGHYDMRFFGIDNGED